MKMHSQQFVLYVIRTFSCYFSTNFFETWLVYRQYLAHLLCEFSVPYAKGQGRSETKQKIGVSAESANGTMYFK